LSVNKSELCKAALSSRMIDMSLCSNGTYEKCAIYELNRESVTARGAFQEAAEIFQIDKISA
jgi:hypothetical protein